MTKHEKILALMPIDLKDPIRIKLDTGITVVYEILHGDNKIWLLTSDNFGWYPLEEKDRNYDEVADAIINHLTNEFIQS
jgi:hypothetical protein